MALTQSQLQELLLKMQGASEDYPGGISPGLMADIQKFQGLKKEAQELARDALGRAHYYHGTPLFNLIRIAKEGLRPIPQRYNPDVGPLTHQTQVASQEPLTYLAPSTGAPVNYGSWGMGEKEHLQRVAALEKSVARNLKKTGKLQLPRSQIVSLRDMSLIGKALDRSGGASALHDLVAPEAVRTPSLLIGAPLREVESRLSRETLKRLAGPINSFQNLFQKGGSLREKVKSARRLREYLADPAPGLDEITIRRPIPPSKLVGRIAMTRMPQELARQVPYGIQSRMRPLAELLKEVRKVPALKRFLLPMLLMGGLGLGAATEGPEDA